MDSPSPDRRSFLGWAVNGLGAIFTIFLGVPVVAYVVDPRNRKSNPSAFKLADGVRLADLSDARPVQQGVIRDSRRDAWTLHPNDVLGRVWVVLQPGKTIPTDVERRKALNSAENEDMLRIFTTICPHLGCSVNLNADGHSFACPCHAAAFAQSGDREEPDHNPANRGMDTLSWHIDPTDPDANRLLVEYRNFKSTIAEKNVVA